MYIYASSAGYRAKEASNNASMGRKLGFTSKCIDIDAKQRVKIFTL
jgi:hypothetical protein